MDGIESRIKSLGRYLGTGVDMYCIDPLGVVEADRETQIEMAKIAEEGIDILEDRIDDLCEEYQLMHHLTIEQRAEAADRHRAMMTEIKRVAEQHQHDAEHHVEEMEVIREWNGELDARQEKIGRVLELCDQAVEQMTRRLEQQLREQLAREITITKVEKIDDR